MSHEFNTISCGGISNGVCQEGSEAPYQVGVQGGVWDMQYTVILYMLC